VQVDVLLRARAIARRYDLILHQEVRARALGAVFNRSICETLYFRGGPRMNVAFASGYGLLILR
jgi:hypothetical protein